MSDEYRITIPGRIRIKKNGKRVFRVAGKVRVLSSQLYTIWEKNAVRGIHLAWRGQPRLTGKISATITLYLSNRQHEPDLSNAIEGPLDALQLGGVYDNDKQVCHIDAKKIIDASEAERVEIILRPME